MAAEVTVAAAEITAPVVSAGTLDYKKVALIAGGTVVAAGCGFLAYRAIKKRKAAKTTVIEVNPENVVEAPAEEPKEEVKETKTKKAKAEK